MARKAADGRFSVTGPGIDRNGYPSASVALSAAITFASRLEGEQTVYARDGADDIVGRVERDQDGSLRIFRLVKDDR